MIRTQKEYKEAIERFRTDKETIEAQRMEFAGMGMTPKQVERAVEPMLSFHAQLEEEITWYENVERGNISPTRLTDAGRLLIAARIARRLTQRDLAKILGVTEASVSRDERNEYRGITIDRAQRLLDAMGYSATATVEPMPECESAPLNCEPKVPA